MIDKLEKFCLNILRKIKLAKLADWYEEHVEGMRYLIFGALSTVVNVVVFVILNSKLKLSIEVSNTIAWIISVIFAYVTNKLYVFKAQNDSRKDFFREIISFFGSRVFTLVVETILLKIFIEKLGFNSTIMKILTNVIVIILNYVLSKIVIFKKSEENKGGS